jgi:hypothetical protein
VRRRGEKEKRRRRSVYDDMPARPEAPDKVIVSRGRVIGYEVSGKFIPAKPCCDDPTKCEKPECWTWVGGEPRGLL